MKKQKTILAYHFTGDKLRDGSPIPPKGKWLVHKGPVVPCESGLHASEHPFDALRLSSGTTLHRVELAGKIKSHGDPVDKLAASKRRILQSIDAEKLLRSFARRCALSVVKLWTPPDVVLEYLKTGNESLRAAARAAVRTAAGDAARAAAGDASWAAARDAARDASWAAAGAAARDAAWAAAWAAASGEQRKWFMEMTKEAFAGKPFSWEAELTNKLANC